MIAETQIRSQILKRIKLIPSEKLDELSEFVSKLEKKSSCKEKILSYAGTWNKMDADIFSELTDNLISNRRSNRRRFE